MSALGNIRRRDGDGNKLFRAETRAAVEKQLIQRIDALRALIVEYYIYLDTVTLLTQQPIAWWIEQRLRQTTKGAVWVFNSKARRQPRCGLFVQQPESETLDSLSEYIPDHLICRTDISLDLITASQAEANKVCNELQWHLTQAHRGRRTTVIADHTLYYGPKQTSRNLALYADKPSKVNSRPAVHLDFRYATARACQRRGITHAMDLVSLDIDELLRRDFRLSAIHWKVANKLLDKEANRIAREHRNYDKRPLTAFTKPIAVRSRIERIILSQITGDDELSWADLVNVPIQLTLDAAGSFLREAAVHVPGLCLLSPQYYGIRRHTAEHAANTRI